MPVLSIDEIKKTVKYLLEKYHAEQALLFGSYARGEATGDSDIDIVVFGGEHFLPRNIFAMGEELRTLTGREADVFEIRELDMNTPFYDTVMREGINIA